MRFLLFLLLMIPSATSAQIATLAAPSAPALTGALNFRDLGGIRTADGQAVRQGLIYRSGELSHLTGSDFEALDALHVRYIFDLRTNLERTAAPTRWAGTHANDAPVIVPISIGFPADEDPSQSMKRIFANGSDPAHVREGMQAITVQIAIDGAPEIGRVLRQLASGDEPAIVHCTAGKDRTGIVTAVLLRILGVPQSSIYADYMRSNDAAPAQMTRLRAASQPGSSGQSSAANPLTKLPVESVQVLMGVDGSYLDSAFTAIDARYGSFDNYVKQGLRLNAADVAALRGRLLEPARP